MKYTNTFNSMPTYGQIESGLFHKPAVMCRYSFKAWKLKFWFRLFAMFDVLFAPKFELTTYRNDGSQLAKTKFDKTKIDNAGRCGLL